MNKEEILKKLRKTYRKLKDKNDIITFRIKIDIVSNIFNTNDLVEYYNYDNKILDIFKKKFELVTDIDKFYDLEKSEKNILGVVLSTEEQLRFFKNNINYMETSKVIYDSKVTYDKKIILTDIYFDNINISYNLGIGYETLNSKEFELILDIFDLKNKKSGDKICKK